MSEQHTRNGREDLRSITGRGRIASDVDLPAQRYGDVVRCGGAERGTGYSVSMACMIAVPGSFSPAAS